MKTLLTLLPLLVFCLTSPQAEAQGHTSQSGEIKIGKLGNWKIKDDAVEPNNNSKLSLTIAEKNLHTEVKLLNLTKFDVMLPAFTSQIKKSLNKEGMRIVTSGPATFMGQEAFRVYAIKLVPRPNAEPLVVFVVSYSAFVGPKKFVTLSLSSDKEEVEADPDVKQLMNSMFVVPKK
jgi:hypothetical protein